jgi:hypothetical protein
VRAVSVGDCLRDKANGIMCIVLEVFKGHISLETLYEESNCCFGVSTDSIDTDYIFYEY